MLIFKNRKPEKLRSFGGKQIAPKIPKQPRGVNHGSRNEGGLLAKKLNQRAPDSIGAQVGDHRTLFVDLPRACFFPEIRTDPKGKARKIYRYERMMTPL
jgi:hypothetical protein